MWHYWRWVLPVIGLILFGMESYHSGQLNHRLQATHNRYRWWSGIRLDAQPTKQTPEKSPSCESETEGCTYEFDFVWVDPGYSTKLLELTALPAFAAEAAVLALSVRLGINQVPTFMITTPISIAAWFYLVGWLIDTRMLRRSVRRRAVA